MFSTIDRPVGGAFWGSSYLTPTKATTQDPSLMFTLPDVPEDLISYMEKRFKVKEITPDLTLSEVMFRAGQQDVLRELRSVHERRSEHVHTTAHPEVTTRPEETKGP